MGAIKLSPEHLETVDNHLRDHSYVGGWFATQSDAVLIGIVTPIIKNLSKYVHISRWWKHIMTLEMAEFQGMTPTVDEVLGMCGASSKMVSM